MATGNGDILEEVFYSHLTRCPLVEDFMKEAYFIPENGEMAIVDSAHKENLLSTMEIARQKILTLCAGCQLLGLHDPTPKATPANRAEDLFHPTIVIQTEDLL